MDVQLVMFRDGGDHRPFSVSKGTTVIGRREDCDLRIAVGDVSRKHCRVITDADGEMRVEDLGSSNGTFVNGHRVQNSTLNAGDTLQVGPVVFIVQVDGAPALDDVSPRTRASVADSDVPAAPAKAAKPSKAKTIDDEIGDIDELEILNDSGDSGGDLLDLDPAEK